MKEKIQDILYDIVNIILILMIATIPMCIVGAIVYEIASACTTEIVSDEVCKVEVAAMEIVPHEEYTDYCITVKGDITEIIDATKEEYLAAQGKEFINIRIIKTTDCFGRIKETISIV